MNLRKGQLATVPLQKPLLQHTVLRGRSGSFSSLPGQLKDGRRVGKSDELQAPRTVTYLMVGCKSGELMYGTAKSKEARSRSECDSEGPEVLLGSNGLFVVKLECPLTAHCRMYARRMKDNL